MASTPGSDAALPPVQLDPLAAVLSYLIPGLGQIYQGRVGKGLLFFGGLYLLFFYGMWMGQWKNVWMPDATELPDVAIAGQNLGGAAKSVAYRWQFLGQFWIGIAAWPAVYQYAVFDKTKDAGPIFGKFQRMPDEKELNELQRNGNKRWDLGWVYTVIAGVLNLLVIYDALAGPMFREPPAVQPPAESATASAGPYVPPPPRATEGPEAAPAPGWPPVPPSPAPPVTGGP
ncbi:MAG: DUF6677 family protein [Gemmataceae bacterium]|nr:DUF6677 family protein [Gemmataceae bacterium]